MSKQPKWAKEADRKAKEREHERDLERAERAVVDAAMAWLAHQQVMEPRRLFSDVEQELIDACSRLAALRKEGT